MTRRSRVIDCIASDVLDPETHLTRVSNKEYLEFLRTLIWDRLTPEQHEMFEKLLASDRARYIACDDVHALRTDTHETRYRRYKQELERLSLTCVDSLVAMSPVPTDQIKLIVTNHTVGGICPPLSSIVAQHLRLPSSVRTLDLAYMGCSAAIWGMELCARLLDPGEVALILSTELTSVMTNLSGSSESLVASCVFGDGIGAWLVAVPPHKYRAKFRARDFSGSLITHQTAMDCIRYEPNPVYHEIRLKDTIPTVAKEGIQKAIEPLIRRNLVTVQQKLFYAVTKRTPKWQENVEYCVLHTAGNSILRSLQQALSLTDVQIVHNFECFRKYGNTSSASVYYSFRELERSADLKPGDRLLFLAYGSGFMTKSMYATVA
jgi:predicted naringenin-chalcone synthase